MFVKEIMTPNPITVQTTDSISSLMSVMREKKLKRIPVMDGTKLVGIVTGNDIQRVSPSTATTLDIYEMNYLLSKTKVKDAMSTVLFPCHPDTYVEDAAVTMRYYDVSALCVTDDTGKLVGIVTQSDLFDALINMLGARESGFRYVLEGADGPGIVGKLGDAAAATGVSMSHFACIKNCGGTAELLVQVSLDTDTDALAEAFRQVGFSIKSFSKR